MATTHTHTYRRFWIYKISITIIIKIQEYYTYPFQKETSVFRNIITTFYVKFIYSVSAIFYIGLLWPEYSDIYDVYTNNITSMYFM